MPTSATAGTSQRLRSRSMSEAACALSYAPSPRRDGVGAVCGGGVGDVGEIGDRVVAGLELRLIAHRLPGKVIPAVDRARHADAAAVDGDDGVGLQHVGARL